MSTHTERQKAVIISLLGPVVAYRPALVRLAGDVKAGLFLCQMFYWAGKGHSPGGWIYKTQQEWTEEIMLSPHEQRRARAILTERGLLEESLRGTPARLYYRLNMPALADGLIGEGKETSQLDTSDLHNLIRATSTTSESTSETTTEDEDGKEISEKEGKEGEATPSVVQASPLKITEMPPGTELSCVLDQFFGPRVPHPPIERTGKRRDWASPVQAGGADTPAQVFVDKLTAHYGMGGWEALPAKKARQWAGKVAEAFKAWGGCNVDQAHLAADAYVDQFGWRDNFNPYEKTFPDNVGALLAKIRSGSVTREGLQAKAAATEPERENWLAKKRREEIDAAYARVEAMTPEEKAAEDKECQCITDELKAKWAARDTAAAQEKADEKARATAALIKRRDELEERRKMLLAQAEAMAEEA